MLLNNVHKSKNIAVLTWQYIEKMYCLLRTWILSTRGEHSVAKYEWTAFTASDFEQESSKATNKICGV